MPRQKSKPRHSQCSSAFYISIPCTSDNVKTTTYDHQKFWHLSLPEFLFVRLQAANQKGAAHLILVSSSLFEYIAIPVLPDLRHLLLPKQVSQQMPKPLLLKILFYAGYDTPEFFLLCDLPLAFGYLS